MSNSLGGRESDRTHTLLVSLSWSGRLDELIDPFSFQEKLSRWWSIKENLQERNSYDVVYRNYHDVYERFMSQRSQTVYVSDV